jgi:di/tricarboxylate transporter
MKYFVIFSILVLLVLLIKARIRASLLFFSLLSLFYFLELIKLEDLLINFVNPAVMTLILLIAVVGIIEKTYLVDYLSRLFFKKHAPRISGFRLSVITSFLSAFLNNTAVVVSFLSAIKNNKFFPPTKFLIPLSYAAILGGVTTLIGTSTNLIVNSFVVAAGLESLDMFDFIYVGGPIMICGVLYLTFFSYRILPDIEIPRDRKVPDYFLEARVLKGSSLIGKNLVTNKLRNLDRMFLAEIVRENHLISPVSPEEIIHEEDTLVFTGDIDNIRELEQFDNLDIFGETDDILNKNLIEVVVSPTSELIGKRIKEVNFRSKFDAAVAAVRHGQKRLSGKIGLIQLSPGDVLVLAIGNDFYKKETSFNNFYFMNQLNVNPRVSGYKGIMAVLLFLFAIAGNALGLIPLFNSLLFVLFLYLVFKLTTPRELKTKINLDLILLIGSAIGISEVMISTGASQLIADFITYLFKDFGVYGGFVGIYLVTLILTELITNNAAAALAFPLAYSTAVSLGADPVPFIMAVAYGASGSFLTPFGYQTNILVYSAGGYKFTDYVKTGFPLTLMYSFLVLTLTPYFFPFH